MNTCFYFAFGSNMLRERLWVADRCPGAKTLGPATADGYRVTMWKRSSRDGTGKATLVRAEASVAHGVLYEMTPAELALLDKSEGVGRGYDREDALPVRWRSGTVAASTYIAPPEHVDETLLPFNWYAALCIAGARQHGLPREYVETLEAIPALPDPVTDRAHRERALSLLRVAGFHDLADRCEAETFSTQRR